MNQLHTQKSPYLLQHADNPVDWFPWGKEAFQKARNEDKPVFLSIGYSTCHWCHVMAHESFEDTEVAHLLNRDFVSMKVDREERPDIDAVYMAVCQALTGSGWAAAYGYDDPGAKPFFAGTVFSKAPPLWAAGAHGTSQTGGLSLENRPGAAVGGGDQITAAIGQSQPTGRQEPGRELLHKAYRLFHSQFDRIWGGFGPAPKFPTPHNLLFLMRYARLEQRPNALNMAETTLQARPAAAFTTSSAAGFPDTPPMKHGWPRTLKKCSTTTPCCFYRICMPTRRRERKRTQTRPAGQPAISSGS